MEQNDLMIRFNWYEHSHRLVIVSVWEGQTFSCVKHCSTAAEGVKATRVPFTRSRSRDCSAVGSRGAIESRSYQSSVASACCHSSWKPPGSVTTPCPCRAPTMTVGEWSYMGAAPQRTCTAQRPCHGEQDCPSCFTPTDRAQARIQPLTV